MRNTRSIDFFLPCWSIFIPSLSLLGLERKRGKWVGAHRQTDGGGSLLAVMFLPLFIHLFSSLLNLLTTATAELYD